MLASLKQTAQFVDFFRQSGKRQTYRKGDYVIRPGQSPPGIFYIDEGLVKAYDITKYHEENLLIIRKKDEIFPLIWAITGEEREIVYQAIASTVTWQVSRQAFLDFVGQHMDTLIPLLDMTIEMYRLHSQRILNLEYRSVRERLVSFLITMAERFGKPLEHGVLIEAPLRHQDIASSINAARETTSRELSALEKKGLIENKQSYITLLDQTALLKYLS